MTLPSVSVVIIVKDGERFLQDALDSVFAQTVPPMELIIVDDGSTDRTPEIIEHAIATSADGPTAVRVLRHPGRGNRGMSRSRNLGLANARGTFTTFLDHDDAMLPRKLEVMTVALTRHPEASAVIGPNRRWRSWSGGRDEDQEFEVPIGVVLPPPGYSLDEVSELRKPYDDALRPLWESEPGSPETRALPGGASRASSSSPSTTGPSWGSGPGIRSACAS